jgi:hypothetical protein
MTGTDDTEISEEARVLAEHARERAAAMPSPAALASIAAGALSASTHGSNMTPAEIRQLAEDALAKAQEVSWLLGRLAGILGPDADGDT